MDADVPGSIPGLTLWTEELSVKFGGASVEKFGGALALAIAGGMPPGGGRDAGIAKPLGLSALFFEDAVPARPGGRKEDPTDPAGDDLPGGGGRSGGIIGGKEDDDAAATPAAPCKDDASTAVPLLPTVGGSGGGSGGECWTFCEEEDDEEVVVPAVFEGADSVEGADSGEAAGSEGGIMGGRLGGSVGGGR